MTPDGIGNGIANGIHHHIGDRIANAAPNGTSDGNQTPLPLTPYPPPPLGGRQRAPDGLLESGFKPMTTVDERDAIKALAYRLTEWGVDDAAVKAQQYIGDLIHRGWAMNANHKPGRRPPQKHEECPQHPGEYAPPICRCCHADKKAERDQAEAQQVEAARLTRVEAIAAARGALEGARGTTTEETA